MGTGAESKPITIMVIGIETPGSDAEMLGTRPLVIRLPGIVRGRKEWCYWDKPGAALFPNWPDFASMYFAGEQMIELSGDKPYRAFRVRIGFLAKLVDRPEADVTGVLSCLPPHMVEGYRYDAGLGAIYQIFNDEVTANLEYIVWAEFVNGIMTNVLSDAPNWKRFDDILHCLMSVSSSAYTPEIRRRWLALRLANCRMRNPDRVTSEMSLFIDRDYPEGHPERSLILNEAQRFENEILAHWSS